MRISKVSKNIPDLQSMDFYDFQITYATNYTITGIFVPKFVTLVLSSLDCKHGRSIHYNPNRNKRIQYTFVFPHYSRTYCNNFLLLNFSFSQFSSSPCIHAFNSNHTRLYLNESR